MPGDSVSSQSRSRSSSASRKRRRRSRSEDEPRRERSGRERRSHRHSPTPSPPRRERHRSPPRQRSRERKTVEADRGDAKAEGVEGKEKEATGNLAPKKGPVLMQQGVFGGIYIPPFKLAKMMKECEDKTGKDYQRLTWDALRKSLNGIVNKVNASNIREMLPELFSENLNRGRGLFCRAVMKSQMASPAFTAVYAALVAVVNTKFPEIGELLLKRIILQFKRSYRRNDKPVCIATTTFLGQLLNQGVVHELLALELLMVILESPTNDSIEVAVSFIKTIGATLQEISPQGLHSIFERLRAILHEGEIEKRCQFIIEGLFAVRKAGFVKSGFPSLPTELDLVEEEDQITHEIGLDEELDPQMSLDVFKLDEEYEKHEKEYEAIKREILGGGDSEEDEGGDEEDSEYEEEEEEDEVKMNITDMTETNEVNLRRTIYLTIMSSLDFEEAGHKLLNIKINEGQESELVTMIIECCSQERTYLKYYGLLAQRFAYLNGTYQGLFEESFAFQYMHIHRLETNKLRNISKLFAQLLATDAISWSIMQNVKLTEEDTTSSSRIFIKILFQELSEILGLIKLNEKLSDAENRAWFEGVFPKDTPRNMRFSINFFTSIGLGGLTDSMRESLKQLQQVQALKKVQEKQKEESSSADSSSEDSSDAESGSSSE